MPCANPEWSTVEYIQQQEVVEFIHALGARAWLWVADLEWGYNNVPIHPDHIRLLAFEFDGNYWCYQVLPMGATSGPFLFTEFMEFSKFAIKNANPAIFYIDVPIDSLQLQVFRPKADIQIVNDKIRLALVDNYLDDLFGGHPDYDIAVTQARTVNRSLKKISLGIQKGKVQGPAQSIDLLGKNYNTVTQIVKLTKKKYDDYLQLLNELENTQSITQRELLSIIGKLRFAASIYRYFNAFVRGLEYWTRCVKKLYHRITIHDAIKRDLQTCKRMLIFAHKSGTPFKYFRFPLNSNSSFDLTIYTDASLTIGMGGICSDGTFFQNKWSDITLSNEKLRDIQWRELIAIYCILEARKEHFRGKSIHIFTDNMSVKWMILRLRSALKRPDCQVIINRIAEICYYYYMRIYIDHIKGKDNIYADALSRYIPIPFHSAPFAVDLARGRFDTTAALQSASNLASNIPVDFRALSFKDTDP